MPSMLLRAALLGCGLALAPLSAGRAETTPGCYSYLVGFFEAIAIEDVSQGYNTLYCPRGAVTAERLRLIFIGFLQRMPMLISSDRPSVVLASFIAAFPCQ